MTPEERAWCDNVTVAGSHPAKYNTWEVAEKVIADKLSGVWVEAGACGGGQIAVMDQVQQRHGGGSIVHIHAFDSWEGIPKATEEDDEPQKTVYGVRKSGDPVVSSGQLLSTLNGFWSNMRMWGARLHNIAAHKGWLQDTLVGWRTPIALLRIDVDLTDSVRAVMRHLYPHLVPGGYCIADDWYTGWSPQRQVMIDGCGHPDLEQTAAPVYGNPGTVWWKKPAVV